MLITVEELEAFMGREFTEAEEAQAEALIQAVTSVIEGETGVSFSLVEDEEIRIQADGYGMIELSAKPISEVTVYDVGTEDEHQSYAWDNMATIYGLQPNETVDVIYTHGYAHTPGDIKAVAYGMTSRIMYNPSGLRQETVGAISVTYPGIGGEAGTINISKLERNVLDNYARSAKSMRLAGQRRRVAALPELTTWNDID